MQTTQTKTLFRQNYRVRLIVGLSDTVEVRNADGKIYRVQPMKNQCSCPATRVCKHLRELPVLMDEQRALWAELAARETDEVLGERLNSLAWNLRAVADRFWGAGEMSIDRRYEGGAAVTVRPERGTAAAAMATERRLAA